MKTIPFGRDVRERDPVLTQVAKLPGSVEPGRDLWPDIKARLGTQSAPVAAPRRWPLALAAGVAIAAVSALLTWNMKELPVRDPVAVTPLMAVSYGTNNAFGAGQMQAREELLRQFQLQLATLSPETQASVRQNLEIIQRAADDIDLALGEDPGNGMLSSLLFNLFQQEMHLYTSVVTADGAGARRT